MKLKLALEVLGLVALAALIAVMPRLVSSFAAYEMATVGMYFIALLGLSILIGYSGQISLGHGAFMAIGGYTTAVLSVDGIYGHQLRDLWTIPVAGLVAAWLFVRNKPGRTLKAIRDSETAAVSSGISLARYKTFAFAMSAFYAGVAGSLYAMARAYMNPDIFPVVLSVYLVAALALGGVDSFVGLILGASAIYVLINRTPDVTRWIDRLPAVNLNPQRPGMPDVIFGAVLILVLILLPTGVGGALRRLFGPLTTRLYSKS